MYGIKSVLSTTCDVVAKLDTIKTGSQKVDGALSKISQIEKMVADVFAKHDDIQKKVNVLTTQVNSTDQQDELSKRVQNLESIVFGSEDISLYENNPNYGILDTLKVIGEKIDNMREEYVNLIGQYVENSTPRLNKDTLNNYETRIQQIESQIKSLESKPKFQVQTQPTLTKDSLKQLQLDKVKK